MRALFSVGTVLRSAGRLLSVSGLVVTVGLTAVTAQAQWQDPLDTPVLSTNKAHTSLLLDVTIAEDHIVAVGERGHIILSHDDGRTWRQAQVPVMTTLTAVYFVNKNTGWAVGHDAVVLNTQDGGLTWIKQFDGFKANEMVLNAAKTAKEFYESELSKAMVLGSDTRISLAEENLENATYGLEDAQIDFEDKSTKPLLDVWFKNDKEGFVIGAYGMIFKTLDGGNNWLAWASHVENPDRFHLNSITKIDDKRLMMVGEAGLMLRTQDAGETWTQMLSPYDGSFFGVMNLSNDVQLAFGLRGNLARSDNFGLSWRLEDTKTQQTLMGATDHLGRIAYVVGNGGAFLKGIDSGRKWESQTRKGRSSISAVVETRNGDFVMVGENGVELLDKTGKRLSAEITSIEG